MFFLFLYNFFFVLRIKGCEYILYVISDWVWISDGGNIVLINIFGVILYYISDFGGIIIGIYIVNIE